MVKKKTVTEEISGPEIQPLRVIKDEEFPTVAYKLGTKTIVAYKEDEDWIREDNDNVIPKGIARQLENYYQDSLKEKKQRKISLGKVEVDLAGKTTYIHGEVSGQVTIFKKGLFGTVWEDTEGREYPINSNDGRMLEQYTAHKGLAQAYKIINDLEQKLKDSTVAEMTGELKKQVTEAANLITVVRETAEASRGSIKVTEGEAKELAKRIKEVDNFVKTSMESFQRDTYQIIKIAGQEAALTLDTEKRESLKRIRYAEAEFLVERKNRKNYILALGIYHKILKTDETEIEAWKGAKYISEQLGLEDSVKAYEEKIKELEAQ